ncbi:MAG: hypothetical protein KF729_08525 [Sandaracinaceae bacterium]|nr:hypothetical protein [Sandaracinaceae bacterium]
MRELWERGRWLLGGALVAGAAAFALATWGGGPTLAAHPLELAPERARLVARVDVGALLRSHLFRALAEEDGEATPRRIERTCGYDPLDQIDEAVVFVSGPAQRPFEQLGFVARGAMARGRDARERLVRCVRSVVREQGGAIEEVEVEGVRAVRSAHGGSHAAFVGDDGVVGGDRELVEGVLRVTAGRAPSARGDAVLARLWDRVAAGRDVVLVGRLPERWLGALRGPASEAPAELEALAAVRAFGLGVGLARGLALGGALVTESERDAATLASEVTSRVDAELRDPMARFSAIGAALRRLRVEAQGADVVVAIELSERQIDDVLGLWHELRRRAAEEEARGGAPRVDPDAAPREAPAEGAAAHDDAPAGDAQGEAGGDARDAPSEAGSDAPGEAGGDARDAPSEAPAAP